MPPVVIDIQTAEDTRDIVHRAVQALTEGKLVAFPTETEYGLAASARNDAAVKRLVELKGESAQSLFPLAIKGTNEALDYVPTMSPLGKRLARRCWPGPVTLVFDSTRNESLIGRLPLGVQNVVAPAGELGLRVPAHNMILDVLRLLVGPVVLTSANREGTAEALMAQDVASSLGDAVSLILDGGRSRFGQPSSIVKVDDNQFKVLRPGVVSEQNLKRLASQILVFVCTGNTCRSPMAEMLCRKMIAARVGCTPELLDDHGVIVMSAGIAAMMGSRPSPEAVEVLKEHYGLDLSGHTSQPLSEQMIRQADHLFVMTRSHLQAILMEFPEAADRVHLLCRDEADVSDPIGGPVELYKACAEQIETNLKGWVDELEL